jgi:hypothetical protein
MSSQGLTVHEANLEENRITYDGIVLAPPAVDSTAFQGERGSNRRHDAPACGATLGFPWLLRLRYIMEKASNLSEAVALWKATNNTVGFNHMVCGGGNPQGLDRNGISPQLRLPAGCRLAARRMPRSRYRARAAGLW